MNSSRRGSNASIEQKYTNQLDIMVDTSEFQDFTSIKDYFHKQEGLK
jgi:hypothetical protein